MKKAFTTFSIIFFLICSISFSENIIITDTGYSIYYPDSPYFLENVSSFSLGSVTDPELLFEFGLLLAQRAKKANAHACVIGYSQLLPKEIDSIKGHFDESIAPFFSINPFKASQVIEWITNGLTAGGIFPVLSAKFGLNDSLIQNLKYRKIFPAILLESHSGNEQTLKELKLAIHFRAEATGLKSRLTENTQLLFRKPVPSSKHGINRLSFFRGQYFFHLQ